MISQSLCPNCFKSGYTNRCAHCGYTEISRVDNQMLLPPMWVLNEKYVIGRVLGAGGFGVTYSALNSHDRSVCAIKEYLPSSVVVRDPVTKEVTSSSKNNEEIFSHGLEVFKNESEILRNFSGVMSIVQVKDCFTENGTAYFAMEYLDGVNLKALARSMGGKLSTDLAYEVLKNIALTLSIIHKKGMLHRDVSPENIFITKKGEIKLIDFGATRFFVGERSRSLSVILKPGFAPPEQYSSKGNQGPWTDIYALCATYYTVVTGSQIHDAPDRISGKQITPLNAINPQISMKVSNAVDVGLSLDYKKRPKTIDEFLNMMGENSQVSIQPSQKQAAKPQQYVKQDARQGQAEQAVQKVLPDAVLPEKQLIVGSPYIQLFKNDRLSDKWLIPKNMSMVIGRDSKNCNIIIEEQNISRIHCSLFFDGKTGKFYLTDYSTNGTFFSNGKRLEKGKNYPLEMHDSFYLLSKEYRLKAGVE